MLKVESILADWKKKRKEWNEIKAKRRASRGKAASRGEVPTSLGEVPASLGEVGALREVKRNVQSNAQPKAQHERAKTPASGERRPVDLDGDDVTLPEWASHPQGVLVGDWAWDDRQFQPAIDLLGFDEYEMDAEIDRFIKHHRGERRHDWNPHWLEWIQALNARQSSARLPEQCEEEPF
ncbi:hypothetical protein [Bradyrhizobium sp. McL0616]|uniref:hypothetical protein n=1 Tax=Bradyrhizobium sp. McL0616 TaxID=3415674 RepID=UPI003CF83B1E